MDREQFFSDERWTIGVIGLGYVGLPLLLTAIRGGLKGIGFDVSESLVDSLSAGRSHIDDISEEELEKALSDGVEFTTDASRLADADAIFICVPSPLGRNRQPDLTFIEAAARTIEQVVRPGQLVSLESTSYPGTTEDYILPAIERAGYTLDDGIYLAFSPERVSPGDELKTGEVNLSTRESRWVIRARMIRSLASSIWSSVIAEDRSTPNRVTASRARALTSQGWPWL